MRNQLHWETVTPLLRQGLTLLMAEPLFSPFRLVGGTSLSLQLGHRSSVDIDLFTDAVYGSLDFAAIDSYLRKTFQYVSPYVLPDNVAMGMSYIVGTSEYDSFKLDIYYTDPFIFGIREVENIRLATIEEIAAMKMDVIQRMGRKKDFWDIHELVSPTFTIEDMIRLHEQRYPYTHDRALITKNIVDFSKADEEPDPDCLRGKHWEIIKLDFSEGFV